MPDGVSVRFPDDMPVDQIRNMVQKKFPYTDFTQADPGFWAGAGRVVRGVATGLESAANTLAPSFLQHDPALTQRIEREKRPPKDIAESIGNFAGKVAPSFLVPETGAGQALGSALRAGQATYLPSSMLAARSIPIAESLAEGGAQGALGGAMVPSDDRSSNTASGALAGAGLRGGGVAARAAMDAIPFSIKNTLGAVAAMNAAYRMGLPWWQSLSLFPMLYGSNLPDVAAKWAQRATSAIPSAPIGATVAETKESAQ